jgi:hypothetical protein
MNKKQKPFLTVEDSFLFIMEKFIKIGIQTLNAGIPRVLIGNERRETGEPCGEPEERSPGQGSTGN